MGPGGGCGLAYPDRETPVMQAGICASRGISRNAYGVKARGRDILTPMTDGTPESSMSPEMIQMRLLLLANRIELEIAMFESDTASMVSSITLTRRPDGGADVSVNLSPCRTH
jgi:hypothetical protein